MDGVAAARPGGSSATACSWRRIRGLVLVDTGFGPATWRALRAPEPVLHPLQQDPVRSPRHRPRAGAKARLFARGRPPHRPDPSRFRPCRRAGGFPEARRSTCCRPRSTMRGPAHGVPRAPPLPAGAMGRGPGLALLPSGGERWFGFEAVRDLDGLPPEILMVPAAGPHAGHAGVAIDTPEGWLLNAGDAYFHRHEMDPGPRCTPGLVRLPAPDGDGPADPPPQPGAGARLANDRRGGVRIFCSHDPVELEALSRLGAGWRRSADAADRRTPGARWPSLAPLYEAEVTLRGDGSMELDALMLSRIQFAFTIAFHIIFPAFTIGLASWLMALEFNWLRTGNPLYRNLFRFWVKVFAVSFGLGVVSGIVMSYQFGTNWSRFSEFTGNVLGPGHRLRGDHRLLPRGGLPRASCCSAGSGRRPAAFLRHLHGGARDARCPPSGSCRPIPGCRRRTASPSRTARRCRSTGSRSSSTRPSRCATPTWCWAAISPRPSRSPACRPG